MELQQLKYFLQICEDRNYEIAANKLFISQQALRKSIKKLESEIGLNILYRKGNRLCLTSVGEYVRARANVILGEVDSFSEGLEAYREDSSYVEMTLALSNGCYDRLFPTVIDPYNKMNPHVVIKIIEQPDLICESSLVKGVADFGFTFGPNDENIFEITHLYSEPLCAFVNVENPLAKKSILTISDFKGVPIGIPDQRFRLHHLFCDACRKEGFHPNIAFMGCDPYSVHHYSTYTKNVSITVQDYEQELAEDNQVVIPISGPRLSSDLNLLVRRGAALPRDAQKFIDYCKFALQEQTV